MLTAFEKMRLQRQKAEGRAAREMAPVVAVADFIQLKAVASHEAWARDFAEKTRRRMEEAALNERVSAYVEKHVKPYQRKPNVFERLFNFARS